jgi:EmrB/QacA subfamily drug resistance transporter
VIFGGASALAAFSGSASMLIVARAVMGVGAALVMPATLSILAHVFPPGERKRAIAIWAGFAGVGAASGGVISGWLLQHFWWGSIFLTNVVVVGVALVAGWMLIPHSKDDHHTGLDPVGALLSIAGLSALVYAIIEAPDHGWLSGRTLGTALVAFAILAAFVQWELRTAEPMLDLRYFRDARFAAATTSITLIFFVMFGTFFVITQYFQQVRGFSPLGAGVRVLPWAGVYMVSAPLSARFVERWGQRRVVSTGLTIVAGGLALLSRSTEHTSFGWVTLGLMISAFGMGLVTAPSTGAIMAALPLDRAGVGSAVNDTTRELGGALGVAVFGSVVASRYRAHLADGLFATPALRHAARRSLGSALQSASSVPSGRGTVLADAARHAYVQAFDVTLLIAAAVALTASGIVAWVLRPAPAAAEEREAAVEVVEAA